jgi:hypothetical protein
MNTRTPVFYYKKNLVDINEDFFGKDSEHILYLGRCALLWELLISSLAAPLHDKSIVDVVILDGYLAFQRIYWIFREYISFTCSFLLLCIYIISMF